MKSPRRKRRTKVVRFPLSTVTAPALVPIRPAPRPMLEESAEIISASGARTSFDPRKWVNYLGAVRVSEARFCPTFRTVLSKASRIARENWRRFHADFH